MSDKSYWRRTFEARQQRDDLTGEYRLGDRGQIIIACLFSAVWISDSFFLNYSTFLNQYVPVAVRIPVGAVLLGLAAFLSGRGLFIVFGEKRDEPSVINKSVFGTVRHPIYLAETVLYLGLLVLSISLAALVVWAAAVAFLYRSSRYEEKLLLKRFGKDYEQYMKRVPMWIPHFWGR
ncbi:MAG: isoprenylcysteine carboxylmethyltransferase family protein [Dehalococcoidales bacterium]|nr:isoprenylcysteine carboxylmethyltransferase family protein [Dehalococcoidales bacterium]